MNDLTIQKKFIETGKDREKEDLSNCIFKDIEYDNLAHQTSFYRSDFRGSKFENMTFYKNNFEIADFINNHFKNVEFSYAEFNNTEIKNCYFEKCIFDKNIYSNSSYHNCIFRKTTFEKEIFSYTMEDCEFIDCKFKDCVYNQCSTENLKFENCDFLKCEMSTMHAENFKIKDCVFRDTYLGLPFLGTYLIVNTDFNLLQFKYRGEIVTRDNNTLMNQIQKMYKEERYFEYLNYLILFNMHDTMINTLSNILDKIFMISNSNVRKYNLDSIFEMFEFYFGTGILTMEEEITIISVLSNYNTSLLDMKDKITYECSLFKIIKMIENFTFSYEHLMTLSTDIQAEFEVRVNTHDKKYALETIDQHISYIQHKVVEEKEQVISYKIKNIRTGSIIVTISSSLLLCFLFIKLVYFANEVKCRIRIDNALTDHCVNLIENGENIHYTKKYLTLANDQLSEFKKNPEKIHSILGNGDIISIILSKIFR